MELDVYRKSSLDTKTGEDYQATSILQIQKNLKTPLKNSQIHPITYIETIKPRFLHLIFKEERRCRYAYRCI